LTVGGLLMGFGIESSSHIYGLIQHICEAFEIVTSDGSLVRATKDENPELFYALPWSYGTIGFLVAAELKIVPCNHYVHLHYYPFRNRAEFIKKFESESITEKSDFVEGLVYSENDAVIMTGKMTNNIVNSKYNPINFWYKPWFYEHVRGFLKTGEHDEYIPLRDYYHRHTRSIFWELAEIIPFGNHPLFRLLFGWALPPKISLLKLTQTKGLKRLYDANHVIQDMLIPINALDKSLSVFHEQFRVYPLWLCPMKVVKTPFRGMVNPPGGKDEMFVDIGAYGVPGIKPFKTVEAHRAVEKYVKDARGFQALYADTHMTRDEFEKMFDMQLYNKMRKKYDCEKAFPYVYDKVSRQARE